MAAIQMVAADAEAKGEPVEYDKHPYDVHRYYDNIPDLVNVTEMRFWFTQFHWFLTGVQRGLYQNDKLLINPRCFGENYVQKFNEYVYTFTENPFGNFYEDAWPEMYMSYMLWYMFMNECGLDHTFNDFSTYCWYRGCWPMQFVYKSGDKLLYILRAVNDAGIVWKEGISDMRQHPELAYESESDQIAKLSA